jgi:uncharacterized protein DUF1553/uncharacterized protein DUF1549
LRPKTFYQLNRHAAPQCLYEILVKKSGIIGVLAGLSLAAAALATDIPAGFRAPVDPPIPTVSQPAWCTSPIDHFILAQLDLKHLHPAPPASREVLIRRAYFDLIGLPPTPEEVAAFAADPSSDAFEKVIDHLLASPHYGERWARHWLDVVRYTDADDSRSVVGDHIGEGDVSEAWRYRDWVVKALNSDLPYDQFVTMQIAGDLLPAPEPGKPNVDGLVATTMYVIGNWPGGDADKEKMMADIVDDQVDVTSRAFLGSTIACARCHDHKFDPFAQKDYYALAGIFFSTHILPSPGAKTAGSPILRVPISDAQTVTIRQKFDAKVAELTKRIESLKKDASKAEELKNVAGELIELNKSAPPAIKYCDPMQDGGVPESQYAGTRDWYVLQRGQYDRKGDKVARGFPKLLAGQDQTPITKGSGRLELAQWVASPDNPMTAKVMVNRLWQHHFGHGIVRTPNNFGKLGIAATNPQLLDWLATRFVDGGWSIKRMQKLIMMSATYQQASETDPAEIAADPENLLLGRQNRQRLEAEPLRDAMLATAGKLDETLGGPSTRNISTQRRSIYLMTVRSDRTGYRMLFDATDPTAIADSRNDSTVAPQALFLMNDPFVIEQASQLAKRALARPVHGDFDRIDWLYRTLYSRAVGASELQIARQMLPEGASESDWSKYCQLLLCSNEFCYVD